MRLSPSKRVVAPIAAAAALALFVGIPSAANAAAPYPSDPTSPNSTVPNLITLLGGYNALWQSSGTNDLHGTVKDADVLAQNDKLAVWINTNATADEQFKALQDAEYENATNTAYDQSITISTALGSVLGPLYVSGRQSDALPLTSALINSSNGTSGAYVGTSAAKANFSYPRPYLPTDPATPAVAGDAASCAPDLENASSLTSNRVGQPYASATGNLSIVRVAPTTDTTGEFSSNDVALDAGYGTAGICTGGSFPSGHTTTAYQAGITLATLLPELAPEILTRASEAGNSRIVLGVHYPIDIMGGRIDGEAALAARWSDEQYRTEVLEPARAELVSYLEQKCGNTLAACISSESAYSSNPYGGKAIPGGTAQIVTDRVSAVSVYTERETYGLPQSGATGLAASVPAGASNLLLTTFPTLTDAQRTSVLAQTEIASGYPLDQSQTADGSWQRLNLAAATSATVSLAADGAVTVTSTGGQAAVVAAPTPTPTPTPSASGSASASPSASAAPVAAGSGSGSGSGSSGSLANTGVDAVPAVALSAGALALGGLAFAFATMARRRRAAKR
ncbi:phosphatase PAP2 family protein [Subtercola endophyticus]|uniref:phosphatase PAP2 family protein n=1 Tax=Subtercola endophyticus TaxID=2895559 RepID=UPI001E600229|nr:phosphatase PAP2 family protein [Subtercola endophyticus]UFS58240.1 phosphatase PAP2 family protein [Subtercola endophyticus]